MATARSGQHTTLGGGLWKGVVDTNDPEDDTPDTLTAAQNIYLPDPGPGCATYSRPGCTRPNTVPITSGQPQGVYCHTGEDGTVYNFLFADGKVYRQSTNFATAPVDVTPTDVAIADGSTAAGRHIFCASLHNRLIVNDGVNQPWIGTNLGNTPITATTINLTTPVLALMQGAMPSFATPNITANGFVYLNLSGVAVQYPNGNFWQVDLTGTLALGAANPGTWGVILVEMLRDGSNTFVCTGADNGGAGWGFETDAIAALPTKTPSRWFVGYLTVQNSDGNNWTGGTDAVFGVLSGNPAKATNYYPGAASPWSAFGRPVIYTGAVVFLLRITALTQSPTTIAWSEPNQPDVGYLQDNYADWFTLTQTGTSPIYALWATNFALYYARDLSWGALQGPPNQFTNNTTQDAIATNIGCVAPDSVQGFGNYIYFIDSSGRPQRFAQGTTSGTEPLWLQMRSGYDAAAASGGTAQGQVSAYTWGIIEPSLNLYLVGCFPSAIAPYAPTVIYAFDASTGRYCGTWSIGDTGGGSVPVSAAGVWRDANNQPAVVFLQAPVSSVSAIWVLQRQAANIWEDNGVTIPMSIESTRFGYSAQMALTVTQVRALTNNVTPVTLTTKTTTAVSAQGPQTPSTTQDGISRAVWAPDATCHGRGVRLVVGPTTTTSQWQCYRLEMDATHDLATAVEL